MNFVSVLAVLTVLFFAALLGAQELGRRIALRRLRSLDDLSKSGTGVVEGAIFALLGLLIAFTFTSASDRFSARRQLIVQEANAIGTSYLRIDVLPPQDQPPLREQYRKYVDTRLDLYRNLDREDEWKVLSDKESVLQAEIWAKSVESSAKEGRQNMVLPPLNEMFDVSSSRKAALKTHVPPLVLALMFILSILGAILAGYSMASSRDVNWLHMISFAAILALTIFTIIDLEYPRYGIIRLDAADELLVEVRRSMK